jgi:hypothetical protein
MAALGRRRNSQGLPTSGTPQGSRTCCPGSGTGRISAGCRQPCPARRGRLSCWLALIPRQDEADRSRRGGLAVRRGGTGRQRRLAAVPAGSDFSCIQARWANRRGRLCHAQSPRRHSQLAPDVRRSVAAATHRDHHPRSNGTQVACSGARWDIDCVATRYLRTGLLGRIGLVPLSARAFAVRGEADCGASSKSVRRGSGAALV